MKRLLGRLAVGATALMIAAPACTGDGGGDGGDFRATSVAGSVTVQAPGEASHTLREGESVPAGTSLKTAPGARVRLESGGRAIELDGESEATLLGPNKMQLELGRVLAEAPGARTLSFDSRGATAQVTGGAARIERKLGRLSVGVYSGVARVDLLGRGIEVPRLRQLDIAGAVPLQRVPSPLQLSDKDSWDRRLLGDVLDFDANLSQYARGFNAEFGAEAVSSEFFTPFVTLTSYSLVDGPLRALEPADILIGLVFAQRLAARSANAARVKPIFDELRALFGLRATWGLIAKERGLDLRTLLQAVLDAIRRGTAPPAPASSPGPGGPRPTSSPSPTSSPRPRPTRSPSPSPSPSPTPTECSVLDQLLGTCDQAGPGGSGDGQASSSGDCSVLGILIDPNC